MRFGFLFDEERKLFAIGYNASASRLDANHYDLLASEARVASLLAIAKGEAPQEHWFRLARPRASVTKKGQRVLVSCLAGSIESKANPVLELFDSAGKQLASHRNYYGPAAPLDVPLPADGEGDHRLQAFCFRMCMSNVQENSVPFPKPANYDEARYELLFRNFEAGDHRRPEVAGLARGGSLELAVAVTAGPEDALRLAPVCTALRRLADPPVILLCDFSGRPETRQRAASSSLGADAVALDPDQLVRHAAERLPTEGRRRWGVRLSRSGGTLVLTPTGRLDATSIGRLFEVALTRRGTFSRLVLDLRDVAAIEPAGLEELSLWSQRNQLEGAELRVVADAGLRERLEAAGLALHRQVLASDVE